MDHFQNISTQHQTLRKHAVEQAEQIIQQATEEYWNWLICSKINTIISQYKQDTANIKTQITQQAIKELHSKRNPEKIITELAQKLTQQMMHPAFKYIKNYCHPSTKKHTPNTND